jgi:hypothetical protein
MIKPGLGFYGFFDILYVLISLIYSLMNDISSEVVDFFLPFCPILKLVSALIQSVTCDCILVLAY